MKALIIGLFVIAVAVLAIIPAGLGWHFDVLVVLRGALPLLAGLIGLILLFAGISDIKEKADAKKEKQSEETTD